MAQGPGRSFELKPPSPVTGVVFRKLQKTNRTNRSAAPQSFPPTPSLPKAPAVRFALSSALLPFPRSDQPSTPEPEDTAASQQPATRASLFALHFRFAHTAKLSMRGAAGMRCAGLLVALPTRRHPLLLRLHHKASPFKPCGQSRLPRIHRSVSAFDLRWLNDEDALFRAQGRRSIQACMGSLCMRPIAGFGEIKCAQVSHVFNSGDEVGGGSALNLSLPFIHPPACVCTRKPSFPLACRLALFFTCHHRVDVLHGRQCKA